MVVGANGHEARELALRARVGLKRHGREPGDFGERLFELADDLRVALHLFDRRKRMHRRELRPGDRNHLGRGVQLHRARPERNHRAIEPDVLALEALQIAHHLRFGAMRREDRMRHERRLARESRRHVASRLRRRRFAVPASWRLPQARRRWPSRRAASSFRRARCRRAGCRRTGS